MTVLTQRPGDAPGRWSLRSRCRLAVATAPLQCDRTTSVCSRDSWAHTMQRRDHAAHDGWVPNAQHGLEVAPGDRAELRRRRANEEAGEHVGVRGIDLVGRIPRKEKLGVV